VPSPSFGQSTSEPDYFAGAEQAQPLTEADTADPPLPQAEILRWKQPKPIINPYVDRNVVKASITLSAPHRGSKSAPVEEDEAEAAEPAPREFETPQAPSAAGWNKSRIGGHPGAAARPVRLAAHDPFRDPFGDRVSQNEETRLQPPAGAAEQPPLSSDPMPERAAPGAEPMPGEGLLPMPREEAPRAGARIYNERDCDKLEAVCASLREQLRGAAIANISLDITPRYVQPPNKSDDPIEFRDFELRKAESRQWRDREGRVLATGRLRELAYDRVIIVDEAGNEVARPRLADLGRDEYCFVTAWWQLPFECAEQSELRPRNWVASTFTYQASALCHKPLYFEEVQLERYGHTAGPFKQPVISGAHFFANIAVLPYKMAINPPLECQYSLGYYRPGSCAPWHIPPVPLSVRGALAEAGAWVGGIYIIP
jgi:hypothetical protein